jgi:hypothetical protein
MADVKPLKLDATTQLPSEFASGDTIPAAMLAVKFPFVLADGTSSPIPLASDSKLPFTLADGSASNIPLTT